MPPNADEELQLLASGAELVAGIDEAGRGCWAGPVVAAAVAVEHLSLASLGRLEGVDDSKALTARQRERLFEGILASVSGWGIGVVPAHVIDTHGILAATRTAMQIAILRLPRLPNALLIDAVELHGWPGRQVALVRGDARCLSIAAASIMAKVARDRLMDLLAQRYPGYGFAGHKGYGTAEHERALRVHGPIDQHRRTFRPLADYLLSGDWPTEGRRTSGRI